MEKLRSQLIVASLAVSALSAAPAFAQGYGIETLPAVTAPAPLIGARFMATSLLRGFLGLLGVFAVSQIVWSVFLLMTHGGNYDRKHKAEVQLKHGLLVLVAVVASSSLLKLIVGALFDRSGLENYL